MPLIAATTGPLCNVLSIAALVTPWRVTLADNGQLPAGTDDSGVGIKDPQWYTHLFLKTVLIKSIWYLEN